LKPNPPPLATGHAGGAELAMSNHDFVAQRAQLVEDLAREFLANAALTGCARLSPKLAQALRAVPREAFVRPADRPYAYLNRPLAIGYGQTISQPYIVALMTQLAALPRAARVLEIGTGSGYQAAVLAQLAAMVYSIEIIAPLASQAAATLADLAIDNVHVKTGDGQRGWPEHAPYDAILVTAGGDIPPALRDQLAIGGRLVIPVNVGVDAQELRVITRRSREHFEERAVLPVRFVPLLGVQDGAY
jgi:protein-L-isoaspartate(D-aspartate) O-methyltransferase